MTDQHTTRPRVAVTLTRGETEHGEPAPISADSLTDEDRQALFAAGFGDAHRDVLIYDGIDDEQGLYTMHATWRTIAAFLARQQGWTDDEGKGVPYWSGAENGASLPLPSGAWATMADIDITDTDEMWEA